MIKYNLIKEKISTIARDTVLVGLVSLIGSAMPIGTDPESLDYNPKPVQEDDNGMQPVPVANPIQYRDAIVPEEIILQEKGGK
ncbi:hypothetical protein KY343_04150 [Candidatus Woesearchaeota archaeon]|nr:hypothetical protein [Candidatus Woesearchaeota archaeon]